MIEKITIKLGMELKPTQNSFQSQLYTQVQSPKHRVILRPQTIPQL